MNAMQDISAAKLGESTVSLYAWLRREHFKGELLPRLRQAATEVFLRQQARSLGLRVEDDELQKAADVFRRRKQLLSSAQTQAWLAERKISADDFEAILEGDLLLAKLREHVAGRGRVEERFAARLAAYDCLQLRRIVVAREDLAREIVTQVQEEGADFAALAAQHSPHASRNQGVVVAFRCLVAPPPVREALKDASVGTIAGPIAAGEGFHLVLVEQVTPGELNPATATLISQQLFQEWLADKLAAAPFSAPLLDAL